MRRSTPRSSSGDGWADGGRSVAALALTLAVCILTLALLSAAALGSAGAAPRDLNNSSAGYYNETVTVDNESWMDGHENATLDNVLGMFSRISTFVIGAGGDSSVVGSLLTSVVAGGIVLGIVGGSAIGIVAGVTVASLVLGALAAAGFAPAWLWAIAVFGIGLVLSTVVIRALK